MFSTKIPFFVKIKICIPSPISMFLLDAVKNKCFIIAELSANHGGKLDIALETIRAAKRAGADAIKIQTYTADTITLDSKKDLFKINQGTHWDGQYLYDNPNPVVTPADIPMWWGELSWDIEEKLKRANEYRGKVINGDKERLSFYKDKVQFINA